MEFYSEKISTGYESVEKDLKKLSKEVWKSLQHCWKGFNTTRRI